MTGGLDAIHQLVDAALQVLDDMGTDGKCCSGIAKATLRIAIEPFVDEEETEGMMPLDVAEKIESECNGH